MTKHKFLGRDIVSVNSFDQQDVDVIMDQAEQCKKQPKSDLLRQKIIASCFFEPSTRTRLSFEAAALRSSASLIGFSDSDNLSIQKGESLSDTVKTISQYADLMIIRHPLEGAARLAADIADIPVINAGDGANQHPTQALTDMFTIRESQGRLDNLAVALVGDLKYGRTIHSLVLLSALYDIRLYLVSPESLILPVVLCDHLKKRGVRFSFHHQIEEVIANIDILYLTRIQCERVNQDEQSLIKNKLILNPSLLKKARPNMKIMHPLPRLDELPHEIDETPYANYFQQAKNGLFVRQALLNMILGEPLT